MVSARRYEVQDITVLLTLDHIRMLERQRDWGADAAIDRAVKTYLELARRDWPKAVVGPHGKVRSHEDFTLADDKARVSITFPAVLDVPDEDRKAIQSWLDKPRAKYEQVIINRPEPYMSAANIGNQALAQARFKQYQAQLNDAVTKQTMSAAQARHYMEQAAEARGVPAADRYTYPVAPSLGDWKAWAAGVPNTPASTSPVPAEPRAETPDERKKRIKALLELGR